MTLRVGGRCLDQKSRKCQVLAIVKHALKWHNRRKENVERKVTRSTVSCHRCSFLIALALSDPLGPRAHASHVLTGYVVSHFQRNDRANAYSPHLKGHIVWNQNRESPAGEISLQRLGQDQGLPCRSVIQRNRYPWLVFTCQANSKLWKDTIMFNA